MAAIPTQLSNSSTDNSGSASSNASLPTGGLVVITVWAALAFIAISYGMFSCWRRGRTRRRAAAQAAQDERFSPPPSYRERSSRKGATTPSTSDIALDLEAQAPELAYATRARTSPARNTSPQNAGQNYGASSPDSPPVPVTYQGFRELSPFGLSVEPPAPARIRPDQ